MHNDMSLIIMLSKLQHRLTQTVQKGTFTIHGLKGLVLMHSWHLVPGTAPLTYGSSGNLKDI